MVKLQEAEDQIVIDYEVYDRRPSDSDLLIAAIETHRAMLGRPPHMVAAEREAMIRPSLAVRDLGQFKQQARLDEELEHASRNRGHFLGGDSK